MKELNIQREGFQVLIHACVSRVKQETIGCFWTNVQRMGQVNGYVLIQSRPKTGAAYPVLVEVSESGEVLRPMADCLKHVMP